MKLENNETVIINRDTIESTTVVIENGETELESPSAPDTSLNTASICRAAALNASKCLRWFANIVSMKIKLKSTTNHNHTIGWQPCFMLVFVKRRKHGLMR